MATEDINDIEDTDSEIIDTTPSFTVFTDEPEVHMTEALPFESGSTGGLAAGAQALGLDGKLLAAQIINFVILLIVLRKFLYKPLLALMEERRARIEESLVKAREIDEHYNRFQIEYQERIEQSKAEALSILKGAEQASVQIRAETTKTAQQEALRLVANAKAEIDREKMLMLREVRKEIGSLVVSLTAKIIGRELDAATQKKLLEEALQEVKS